MNREPRQGTAQDMENTLIGLNRRLAKAEAALEAVAMSPSPICTGETDHPKPCDCVGDIVRAALNHSASERPALTSGDGSESAGLRRSLTELADKWLVWANGELGAPAAHFAVERCAKELLTALAPAISRPPTQGAGVEPMKHSDYCPVKHKDSSLPPSRADLGGDRTIQFEEALRDLFGLVECGELVRDISRDGNSGYHLRMLRLVSVLKNAQTALALTEPALAEGQQSSKLVDKPPSASSGSER